MATFEIDEKRFDIIKEAVSIDAAWSMQIIKQTEKNTFIVNHLILCYHTELWGSSSLIIQFFRCYKGGCLLSFPLVHEVFE